jgi:hypothetical protein
MKTARCILLLALAASMGCGDGRMKLPTASVSGTVTYRGKPLASGKIIFFHETGQAGSADISADGAFTLTAFQGKNQVAIECYAPNKQNPNSPPSPGTPLGPSLIPRRYIEAGTSGLEFDVKPGDNKAEIILKD